MRVNDAVNENDAVNNKINNKKTASRHFEYKTKIIRSTPAISYRLDAEVGITLKYLSIFWSLLNLPLINYKIELNLKWSRKCITYEISRTAEVAGDNPVEVTLTTGATFHINSTKLYVPVVALSMSDNIKFFLST